MPLEPRLDLYWIPIGAGARVVRLSGWLYEALLAFLQRRPRRSLFHSALIANTAEERFVIEVTPVPAAWGEQRGVVAEGAVGTRFAGRFRVFRYEIRLWRGGVVPDISFAVASPVCVTEDLERVQQVLEMLPSVPTPVWGRDELRAGEMWNSNSVIAWLLVHTEVIAAAGRPPGNGRAPGWDAGIVQARRDRNEPGGTSG